MIQDIFKGSKDIPADMYERTFKKLSEGVSTGYGDKLKDGADLDMVYQLKNNVKVFSAFKANSYKDTMISLLVDKDNKQRSWGDFLKEAKKVDNDYNKTWLAAEFNMATRQARGAKQWLTFERDADIYPNLQFMPSRSANPRDAHQKYYGIIKPINDPFWSNGYPPLDWGCKCWVKQTREPATDSVDTSEDQNGHDGLAGNAGIEKKVFTADHNYLAHLGKGEKDQVKKFLQKHSDLGTEEIHLTIGKNKITVPLDADPEDLIHNVNFLIPFVKSNKKNWGINSHKEGDGKQPELNDTDKRIGDVSKMDGDLPEKTVKNWFKKTQPDQQLYEPKSVFMGIDFQSKLNQGNYYLMARRLDGNMDKNPKVEYALLKNGDKHCLINNSDDFYTKVTKIKKELL